MAADLLHLLCHVWMLTLAAVFAAIQSKMMAQQRVICLVSITQVCVTSDHK